MKRISAILALLFVLCLLLAAGTFASGEPSAEPSGEPSGEASGEAVQPGEYTDGVYTLVIADDMTFSMDKKGQNMEGAEFVLTVTGTVTADGEFAVTGLWDGEFNLMEVASAEQIAADLQSVKDVYAAATAASGEPSGEAKAPGEYTDGVNTVVLAADGTFTMDKTGFNMEGTAFVLTVKGHLDGGKVVLDGLFDGDINLMEVATAEQIAADTASVESALAG